MVPTVNEPVRAITNFHLIATAEPPNMAEKKPIREPDLMMAQLARNLVDSLNFSERCFIKRGLRVFSRDCGGKLGSHIMKLNLRQGGWPKPSWQTYAFKFYDDATEAVSMIHVFLRDEAVTHIMGNVNGGVILESWYYLKPGLLPYSSPFISSFILLFTFFWGSSISLHT